MTAPLTCIVFNVIVSDHRSPSDCKIGHKTKLLVVVGHNVPGDQVEKLAESKDEKGEKGQEKAKVNEHGLHHHDQEIETLENLEEIDYLNECKDDQDTLKARDQTVDKVIIVDLIWKSGH